MQKINHRAGNLVSCMFEGLVGILLLINPVGFTSGIIIVLGIVFAVTGVRHLIRYFRADAETAAEEGGLAKGLLLALFGLFCIFKTEWFIVTFPLLTVLYGILSLVGGANKVQWAVDMYRSGQKYWFVEAIGAALSLLHAVLIFTYPFASTAILWTFIGIAMIMDAVVDVVAFILGRK